jgi:hypothetical protein
MSEYLIFMLNRISAINVTIREVIGVDWVTIKFCLKALAGTLIHELQ